MIDWLIPFFALLLLLGLSAFFSSTETALFSLRKIHTRRLEEQSPALGVIVTELLATPWRLLSTILLGNTIVNTVATALVFWLLVQQHLPSTAALGTIAIMVVLLVTVGELLPKLLAVLNPIRVVRVVAGPTLALVRMMGPLLALSQGVSDTLLRLVAPKTAKTPGLSDDEVGTLLEISLQEGVLRETEKNMIQDILHLRRHTAKDLLTPRVDMACVPATMPKPELIAFLKKANHRRVPIYDESPDTIVGVLDVRKFLLSPDEDVLEIMDPPSFVPESMNAARLLKSFQIHKQPMAIVVDEFGGTEGVLTMSDILEEIVGDTAGEFRQSEQDIRPLSDHAWQVSGETRLDDLNEQLGLRLAGHGVETVGGLVATRLGGIPRPGAQVRIGDVQFTVERVAKNRITGLRLDRMEATP
ncbi:MAG: HlyC/CorC family transporter [Verrucomicrobia bacterium]|nr:HlyC/CorC family transporter [Verrucomicrobiota bacterium]